MNDPLRPATRSRQLAFIDEFVTTAAENLRLRAAVLVGSMVDGTVDELSDVDLILVASDKDLARVRDNWRDLIPGRVLYSSGTDGSGGSSIHVLTGNLVAVDLTILNQADAGGWRVETKAMPRSIHDSSAASVR